MVGVTGGGGGGGGGGKLLGEWKLIRASAFWGLLARMASALKIKCPTLCIIYLACNLADRCGSFVVHWIVADSCPTTPTPILARGLLVSIGLGKYCLFHWHLFSVTVPGGAACWGGSHSQGCHGMFQSCEAPPTDIPRTSFPSSSIGDEFNMETNNKLVSAQSSWGSD